ncbi:MAG: YicC/YloC family endoribonuclease, partial [Desulfobacteraceae bacterium]
MTAFGRSEEASGQVRVTVEIRSVNHRYRDLSMRLPRALQPLEEEIKS